MSEKKINAVPVEEEFKGDGKIGGDAMQDSELSSHIKRLKPTDEQLKISRKQIEEGFVSPIYQVQAIPVDKIKNNFYNPNSVADPEMALLYDSILNDGFTQPIVVARIPKDEQTGDGCEYVLVDGAHRVMIPKIFPDIYEREHGMIPATIIEKDLADRMASTIRHNRARGSHDVDMMSKIVGELHTLGRTDHWIQTHLGMDQDEVIRLKQMSGLLSLFTDADYSKSWDLNDLPDAKIFDEK